MIQRTNEQSLQLSAGRRVRVCDETLQAFYGVYGTVLRVATCRHDGHITHIDVQVDDLPAHEGYARFYPHEINPIASGASHDER
jgi:hypothetical protein